MSRITSKPRNLCVFCEYWTGNAGLKWVSAGIGYEFDGHISAKCMKRGSNVNSGSYCSNYFEPNYEAKKYIKK